jgi:hypothetical protein
MPELSSGTTHVVRGFRAGAILKMSGQPNNPQRIDAKSQTPYPYGLATNGIPFCQSVPYSSR